MSQAITLETRLQAVEKELAALKNYVHTTGDKRPWYEQMVGSMKDYPEFTEVVRLGRDVSHSERDVEYPE